MDDSLTLLHNLTWRSRLHGLWHRFVLYITGARYTAKLLRLTHQNLRVLQHFRRCREVEHLQPERYSRFWHLTFYTETFRQSLRLFSPLRARRLKTVCEAPPPPRRSHKKKKKNGVKTPALRTAPTCRHQPPQQTSQLVHARVLSEAFPPLIQSLPGAFQAEGMREQLPRTRRKVRFAFFTWLLSLRHLPARYFAKYRAVLRIEEHKSQQREFYQQAQLTLLQEQQRIAMTTQTALFLSLVTAIDLKASRELTAAGQLVGKYRQCQTMTPEDIACFNQSLNALDGNHETLRVAVR